MTTKVANNTLNSPLEDGLTGPDFYLQTLRVQRFRMFEDETFCFGPTLNVVIGANNSGKTALIDALRIVLNLGSFQAKEDMIRLRSSDLCRTITPSNTATISFEATFCGRGDELSAQFYDMDANATNEEGSNLFQLRYEVQFQRNRTVDEYRFKSAQTTGGQNFQNPVTYESLDYIKSIYLAPLRNIVDDRGRLGRDIERLVLSHGEADTLNTIPNAVRQKAMELISAATQNSHETAAGLNLAKYARAHQLPDNSIKFLPSGLGEDMLRSLEVIFEHRHHGPDKLKLASNGLGINNLIYASIVLARSGAKQHSDDKRFLLVEEPEAHLHPQSQDTFFHELNEFSTHQVFVTSHSPSITAKCDIDKIIVMGHPCGERPCKPCHISQILAGHDADKRYLHKFLDVTRSQLLFARGVVFVEGVTEAMLLQRFSEIQGASLRDAGVEIVALGSNGGFDHFRELLGANGLAIPSAFLTDGDESPASLSTDKTTLVQQARNYHFSEDGTIRIYKSIGTFELEILLAASGRQDDGMRNIVRQAFTRARGSTDEINAQFAADFMNFDNPHLSYRKMKQEQASSGKVAEHEWLGDARTNSQFISKKSDFAYWLFEHLRDISSETFTVPPYIADAIRFVQAEPTHGSNASGVGNPAT